MTVPSEIEELVAGATQMVHLATCHDDRPHVAPVWYHYDDDHVLLFTGGRKVANIRKNPRVALSIEAHEDGRAEWMVAMQGTARIVEDEARVRDAVRPVFGKYLGSDVEAWPEDYRESLREGPEGTLLDVEVASATRTVY